jgi:mannobiose 2-epimerase
VRTLLTDVETRLAFLTTNTADWWLTHGVDANNGGFYGTLNAQGTSVTPRDKGLIQETRHLWAFSIYYERRGASAAAKAAADSTYQFLVSHMRDASDGEFYFKVNETGTSVVDSKKQLYAEGFAVYALAEYGRVFNLQAAKDYALACFRHMDARAHDATYGGYDQRNDSVSMPSGAEKETNTHIHLMEAFTALYRATSDATVGARLNEMIDVVAKHLLQPTNYVAQYFKVDWTPTGSVIVSYGHDIETTWLLLDAARAAARDTEAGLLAAALAMGKHSSERGFNATTGAYNYEGVPNTTTVTNTEHIWWVEFESLSGNYWLYRLTCDPVYLTRLESTLKWIEARRDPTYGEWYWGNLPNGSVGPHGTNKGDEWKASYHNLRALMFAGDWVHGTLN